MLHSMEDSSVGEVSSLVNIRLTELVHCLIVQIFRWLWPPHRWPHSADRSCRMIGCICMYSAAFALISWKRFQHVWGNGNLLGLTLCWAAMTGKITPYLLYLT